MSQADEDAGYLPYYQGVSMHRATNRRNPRRIGLAAWTAVAVGAAVIAVAPIVTQTAALAAPTNVADDVPNLNTPALTFANTTADGIRQYGAATAAVARGADGSVIVSRRSGDDFAPFFSVGGVIVGDPGAIQTPAGIEIFVRGTDDQVYVGTVTAANGFSGFSVVPGLLATSEVEVTPAPGAPEGSVRIFARGYDGAVWNNTSSASS